MTDPINAIHETNRKFVDDLGSVGIDPKSVRLTKNGPAAVVLGDETMHMAMLTRQNQKKHNDVVAEHADHLASRGVRVTTATYACGHTQVSNLYRTVFGEGEHTHFNHNNNCDSCRWSI